MEVGCETEEGEGGEEEDAEGEGVARREVGELLGCQGGVVQAWEGGHGGLGLRGGRGEEKGEGGL